jgi:TRAP transporter TAXI family solute receptor
MRKPPRFLSALLPILAGLVLGCGGGPDAEAPQRRFLSLGTAPPGGAFFVVGSALGEVLQQYGPGGWQVTAEATKGTQENIRRLASGELDLALANAAISHFAVRGEAGWERAFAIRAVMTLAPNVALFIAPTGSGVERIADLAGRRVVVGPAGAGFEYFLRPILAAHGVTYDDFTPLYATQSGAVDLLADGSADVAFLGGAVPTASITQAATTQDVRFVPFDEEAKERLVSSYPFFQRVTVPAGTYRGQAEEFAGLNVGSMHLITYESADEELIYQATRTLWEERERVVEKHAAGRAIQAGNVVRDTGTPFHPGAERFYREIGIWPGGG